MIISTSHRLFPGTNTTWSPDRAYRYFLRRPWEEQLSFGFADAGLLGEQETRPPIAFLLLNPSTADELKDDPTVARCRRFAVAWGYGEVMILNAFAYRATDPKDMKAQADPVGPDNDTTIQTAVSTVLDLGGRIVCGWGNHGSHMQRTTALLQVLGQWRDHPQLLGFPKTKSGDPGHPLYLRKDVLLTPLFEE